MFREMRRKNQILSYEENISILENCSSGVLAVLGDNNYPYAVPLSYVYYDNSIFFHCAKEGHKIDSIIKNNKVSFCIVEQDNIMPQKYTTYYRSIIAFGKAQVLEDNSKKRYALEKLAAKYSPDYEQGRLQEIERLFKNVCIVKINIEHMTGKESIELANLKRNKNS